MRYYDTTVAYLHTLPLTPAAADYRHGAVAAAGHLRCRHDAYCYCWRQEGVALSC